MPVDTSMYAPRPQQNPLEMLAGVAGAAQQIQGAQRLGLENVDLQRSMAAHQAVGQAAQAATDPTSGEVDPTKFMAGVAGNPDAAYGAVDAQQQALSMRTQQLAQAQTQYHSMNSAIAALLDKPDVSAKDVTSATGTLVAQGVLTAKGAAAELASMPPEPEQMKGWLRQHLARGIEGQAQVEALIGTPHAIDTGGNIVFKRTPAMGETPEPLATSMTPGEAATPVPGPITPEGQPTVMPKGQFAQNRGPVVTGLSPGQTAAQTASGGGVAQDALAFENAARTNPDLKAALANMSGDLEGISSVGPNSHDRARIVAAVNGFLGTDIKAEDIAKREGLEKVAAQVMARQRALMGMSNTDAQTNIMANASPGSQLSALGNKNQIALIKGNADALDAENKAWERYKANGNGGETFHKFATAYNSAVDPLVFQYQYMGKKTQADLLNAMTVQERQRFAQSLAFARHNGLVK